MPKPACVIVATFFFAMTGVAQAAIETVVTHEDEKYFYRNGRMKKYDGQYECTYQMDLNNSTLVRTRVYDFQSKKITPDETVYQIQTTLESHPSNAKKFAAEPFVRAFGLPGPDTAELLVIKGDVVHSIQSTPDSIIVSRGKRLK